MTWKIQILTNRRHPNLLPRESRQHLQLHTERERSMLQKKEVRKRVFQLTEAKLQTQEKALLRNRGMPLQREVARLYLSITL